MLISHIIFRYFLVQLISNISIDVNAKLSLIEGNTFTVRCVANTKSDTDEVVYKWTLNDAEIIPLSSSRFQINSNTNFSELSVGNTNQRDTGERTMVFIILNYSKNSHVEIHFKYFAK